MTFLLPPPPEGFNASEILAPLSGFPYQRTIQPAGKGYQKLLKFLAGEHVEEPDTVDEKVSEEDALEAKLAHKHKALTKEADYYELMGLGDVRWRATDNDIKLAYRKMILIYHPDKMKGQSDEQKAQNEHDDEIFKSIQKAYDVLSDPKKRRTYDSQDEFDDTIPSERQAAGTQDFFKLFEPVFERNARWSNIQPAPKMGDPTTPYVSVKKFYDFWWDFKTWRDFTDKDEYDLEQAESRDEKRWMIQQNEKLKAGKRQEERSRIIRLAELAYKYDPRIKKYEADKEAEKQRRKDEKANARKKQQEEVERQAELERKKKEDEDKAKADAALDRKKQREREAKKLKNARTKLRTICKTLASAPSEEDVELVCMKLNTLQLTDLCKSMQVDETQAVRTPFDEVLGGMKKEEQDKVDAQQSEYEKKRAEREKPWTEEELTALSKGLAKYPGGMANRWDLIAELIPTRRPRDIASKVKDVKSMQVYANKNAVFQQKDPFEKLKAKVGDKPNISSAPSERFESENYDAEKDAQKPQPDAASVKANGKAEVTANGAEKPAEKPAEAEKPQEAAGAEPVWSADEQKVLEKGLQQFASGADRWDKISEMIGTKTKKEVVARYKHLVSLYKGKK